MTIEILNIVIPALALLLALYFSVKNVKARKAKKKIECVTDIAILKTDVKKNGTDINNLEDEVKENKNGSATKEELEKGFEGIKEKMEYFETMQDVKFNGLREVMINSSANIMEATKSTSNYVINVEKKIDEHIRDHEKNRN